LLNDTGESVRRGAVHTLAAFRHDDALQALRDLVADTQQPRALRQETVRVLARDRSGSVMLVTIAENGELPTDLTLDVSELLHASRWDDIRLMAEQTLPRDVTREGVALPPLEDLTARTGDAATGRAVFFSEERSQCYTCHRINGEGRDVGPDLSKIGEKLSKQGILESILNPSAAIAHEFKVWMVRSEMLGYLSGYIRSETDEHVELMEATGNPVRIRTSDVIERWESELSLMPTGLSAGMTVDELIDLTEYLTTLR
jgi:putative heme-binding domain-containing protein